MPQIIVMRIEELAPLTQLRILTGPNGRVSHRIHREPNTLPLRNRAITTSGVALPKRRSRNPQWVWVAGHRERDPIRSHDLRDRLIVGCRKASLIYCEKIGGTAVELATGGEGHLEDCGPVGVALDCIEGHLVCWAWKGEEKRDCQ